MRWVFLVVLLISCNSEDEDMRLFQTNLGGQSSEGGDFVLPENGVIVMLGSWQSNMDGRAYNTDALPEEIDPTDVIKVGTEDSGSTYVDLFIQGNNATNKGGRHSIELGLSNGIWDTDRFGSLYMNKYAIGGTLAVEQLPSGSVYEVFITDRVKPKLNQLRAEGKRPFQFMVLMGGESDADSNLVSGFRAQLDEICDTHRAMFGANLPILMSELGLQRDRYDEINDIFHEKAADDPNFHVIYTGDLVTYDTFHWSYADMKIIAQRFYDVIKTLQFQELENDIVYP